MAPSLTTMLLSVVAVMFVFQASTASQIMERILAQNTSSAWKTLSGSAPLVIAHGGLSGVFPDQTAAAYILAVNNSLLDTIIFCDLQLTKDGKGLCRTGLALDNSTDIAEIYPNHSRSYLVNGHDVTGWFSIDFTSDQIFGNNTVTARQSNPSRTPAFDNTFPVLSPSDLTQFGAAAIWLNVQYSKFFEQHNLSMSSYVRSTSKVVPLNYISSPEVEFLRGIGTGFRKSKTKIILRFLDADEIEPSTNETYGSLLNNLTFVKTFASGILVPKSYIWPVSADSYLQPHTSLVQDAHTAGLEVFAADFANDAIGLSYNYSFDPIREYLQFVDTADFAVDGVVTDFSVTASEAVACYAHNGNRASSSPGKPLIIAHNGASGDYPGCTDIAYQAAIKDGADYIGCSVQVTKDGILICRESIDLLISTTVVSDSSLFPSRMTKVPDIQKGGGVFTFNLTWKEIQSLKPKIYSPFDADGTHRNPAYANAGKFMTLTDFLELAKSQANVGVLINVQYARYLASAQIFDITAAIISSLKKNGYDNMTQRVRIQSDDSAVLREFQQKTSFKLVYEIDEADITIPNSSIKQIKEFADTVTLSRSAVFLSTDQSLLAKTTNAVHQLQLQNISVFIFRLRNEFLSLAFDYQADPTMEINTFVQVSKADGLMTDFPATAKAYLGNACLQPQQPDDYSMFLVVPGALLDVLSPKPPALPPAPALGPVYEPPLPSVSPSASASGPSSAPANVVPAPSTQASIAHHFTVSLSASLLIGLFILIWNCN